MSQNSKLVGLVPYQEKNNSVFFGREKEVENLLQIIQKNKLITLTGPSGSGKTSLINAGLIPRLRKGFLGQSGKDWAICKFRPGVSPIDNMIGALTTSGVFNIDLRSNTEDFLNYKKIIDQDQSLSLSKIYSNSEINEKKNLLIVVDQIEDLFLYSNINFEKEGEDQLLIDIISRTVRIKEISVYFSICLQTEHIPRLNKFSNIQELFNKSQYSIQNIGSEGLKKLIKKNFTENGIGFDSNAYNELVKSLTNDLSLLPNIQFLLYRLFHEKLDLKKINKEIINELGGVKNVISNKLEEIFISLPESDQEDFSKLLRATMNFKNPENQFFANSFKNLLEISGLEKANAERLIFIFKKDLGQSFCVFEEKISGIKSKIKQRILLGDIISFKYQKNKNWVREEVWKDQEKSTFLSYVDFANLANKFALSEISLMSSPELESSIKWRDSSIQNENWSKKYSLNYSKTIDYINKSELTFNNNKKREELAIRRKKRVTKGVISAISTLTVIAIIMAIGAFINKGKAEKNFREANMAKELAEKKSTEAEIAREEANESALIAIEEKKLADSAKIIAQNSLTKARIAEKKAVKSALLAEEQKKLAEASFKVATEKQKEALIQKEKATVAKDQAEKLREIALLETEFYPLMLELEKIIEDNSYETSKELIINTIEEALKKYYKYKELLNVTNSGTKVTEGLFVLLQTTLRILENKNSYRETSMKIKNIKPVASIRSISSFENSIIALGGDDRYLYLLNGATKAEIPRININERIRKVKIASSSIIFVGTFKGNVYQIDLKANNSRDRKKIIYKAATPIKELHYNSNLKELFIISSKKVVKFQQNNLITLSENIELNSSAYIEEIKGLLISSNNGLLIQTSEDNYSVNINEVDLNSEKITAISLAGKRLFLGTSLGQIYVYKVDFVSNTKTSLTFESKIILHRSEITKLFYDSSNNNLYSASFDNQVLKYNIDFKDLAKITNNAISFTGHEKWVWDINQIKDSQGNDLIITADENGNLLSWFDATDKLVAKVEKLLNTKRQEN